MNNQHSVKAHWSFWVISVFALIWHVLGSVNFFMQMDSGVVASFPETHRAIIEGRPGWATGGFGLAVLGGAIGSLLLLLRKQTAINLFVVSFTSVIVTMIHTVRIAGQVRFSIPEIIVMMTLPAVATIFLIWYSKLAGQKNWLVR